MKTRNFYTLQSNNAPKLVQEALDKLNWDYIETDNGYEVDFGINLYTWGSTMQIIVQSDNEFDVCVETKWPLQIIDWGDGNNKINKLIAEVKRLERERFGDDQETPESNVG